MTPWIRTVLASLRKGLAPAQSEAETAPPGGIEPPRPVSGDGLSPGSSARDNRRDAVPNASGSSGPPGDRDPSTRLPGAGAGRTNLQHRLERVRGRPISMIYDEELPGAIVKRALPFIIGVLADLSGDDDPPGPLRERQFQRVDRCNFDPFLRSVGPSLRLSVPNRLQEGGRPLAVGLTFRAMDDFRPAGVASQIEPLRALLGKREPLRQLLLMLERSKALEQSLRRALDDPSAVAALAAELAARESQDPSGLDPSSENDDRASDASRTGNGQSILESLICAGGVHDRSVSDTVVAALRCLIAEGVSGPEAGGDVDVLVLALVRKIDAALSAQLAEVLHDPRFQRLESTWRGLHYLICESETDESLQIRVLDVRRAELLHDFESAGDVDRTWLFKRVHDDVFASYKQEPFGILLSAEEFGRGREDLALLRGMSDVAASAHAPFIAAASPGLFGLERFADFHLRNIMVIFASTEYAEWKAYRNSESARYAGLTVPRVLLRLPYGRETVPIEEFAFEEGVEAGTADGLLWGSAAWMLAARVADSFARRAWPAEIRGLEGGGRVDGLPRFASGTNAFDAAERGPIDATISEWQEHELPRLGFIPLIHIRRMDQTVFFSAPSCLNPPHYDKPEAEAVAAHAAQLPVVLAASRLIHYLRWMTRGRFPSSMDREAIEHFVNRWVRSYVWADETAPPDARRGRPFREARIEVSHDPARPGQLRGVAFLRFYSPNVDFSRSIRFEFPIG